MWLILHNQGSKGRSQITPPLTIISLALIYYANFLPQLALEDLPTVGPTSTMKKKCKGWSFIAAGSDLDFELDTPHYYIMVHKITELHWNTNKNNWYQLILSGCTTRMFTWWTRMCDCK